MDLEAIEWESMDSIHLSGKGKVMYSSLHTDEPSSSINCREFVNQLRNSLLVKDSDTRSQLMI
jgi:hypothetical protein